MAYTEVSSNEIPEDTQYYSGKLPLGDYDFYLQYDAATATVVTRCDFPDGIQGATQRKLPDGAHVLQWSIEANETEASVYALVAQKVDIGDISHINQSTHCTATDGQQFHTYTAPHGMLMILGRSRLFKVFATDKPGQSVIYTEEDGTTELWPMNQTYTANGKTVYYHTESVSWAKTPMISPQTFGSNPNASGIAWTMVYGDAPHSEQRLVARFAINIGDAGGYPGGGGGWISPGDWNPDPTTTLHLTVNGALSGRHNDPLDDPSYSYVPADNMAEAGYGCGGDGGHGGGGGGGASTVITEQFATNKANSKVIVVTVKRHGYGSGGSKGAKGGDGCILIYY